MSLERDKTKNYVYLNREEVESLVKKYNESQGKEKEILKSAMDEYNRILTTWKQSSLEDLATFLRYITDNNNQLPPRIDYGSWE